MWLEPYRSSSNVGSFEGAVRQSDAPENQLLGQSKTKPKPNRTQFQPAQPQTPQQNGMPTFHRVGRPHAVPLRGRKRHQRQGFVPRPVHLSCICAPKTTCPCRTRTLATTPARSSPAKNQHAQRAGRNEHIRRQEETTAHKNAWSEDPSPALMRSMNPSRTMQMNAPTRG